MGKPTTYHGQRLARGYGLTAQAIAELSKQLRDEGDAAGAAFAEHQAILAAAKRDQIEGSNK